MVVPGRTALWALVLLGCALLHHWPGRGTVVSAAASDKKDCVKWGGQFDVPLRSKNVRRDCQLPDGRPVCCAATTTTAAGDAGSTDAGNEPSTRGVGYSYDPPGKREPLARGTTCTVSRDYVSSPQELRELRKSHELQAIADPEQRLAALMQYVTSPEMMANATRWLARVALHMRSEASPTGHRDDREYLSRWVVTKTCSNGATTRWEEWIEPVNVAARHPFAFSRCRHTWQYYKGADKGRADRSDVDYVLLQSGVALHNATLPPAPTTSGSRKQPSRGRGGRAATKHFFLDAGTSTFDSSLFWFTCAYSQRRISFNDVYGWEMTLLDPQVRPKKPQHSLPHQPIHNSRHALPLSSPFLMHCGRTTGGGCPRSGSRTGTSITRPSRRTPRTPTAPCASSSTWRARRTSSPSRCEGRGHCQQHPPRACPRLLLTSHPTP